MRLSTKSGGKRSSRKPILEFISVYNARLYRTQFTIWFLAASSAADFETAYITQLIQVALLRRRLCLAQIQGDSLPYFQILNHVRYITRFLPSGES